MDVYVDMITCDRSIYLFLVVNFVKNNSPSNKSIDLSMVHILTMIIIK